MEISTLTQEHINTVVEMIYTEKKEFFDKYIGKSAKKHLKNALEHDLPPFKKNLCYVLLEDGKVKSVLCYATKDSFRHGYQKWFKFMNSFEMFKIGSKIIYVFQKLLINFTPDDIYIITLYGESKNILLHRLIKENRYKRLILDSVQNNHYEDLGFSRSVLIPNELFRYNRFADYENMTGLGWDTHKLVKNRKLVIGGLEIPAEVGLLGHSDADVLCHSIIDSLVGVATKSDIGTLFPENEENYGAYSLDLLNRTVKKVISNNYIPVSADCVVISKIRLSKYRQDIIQNLESVLNCPVSIKFKSGNEVYPESFGEGITAICVSNIDRIY